ncbi:zinc finger, CCHC-type containing protein [Tanacetum coccineum]
MVVTLLVQVKDLRIPIHHKDDAFAWWIDSDATFHACKGRCWFDTCHLVQDGSVLHIGDELTKPILGRGNVVLEFSFGKTITLVNVVYVPGLRKNLMSGPMLNKCGCKQVYESDKYILSRHGVFVGFGYYNNGIFMLNPNKVPNTFSIACMISSKDVDSSMWHARLGHVHYKRMLAMSKDNLIPEFDITLEKCNTCMLTKITRQPFKDIRRDSNVLELINSNLCDFHTTPSLGNKKYVVTFIDDASRFCYVYLCHAKDEALYKFKIYKTEVELQQNDLIKTLRTDKGGEYYDPVYFQSVGIIHETTAPYTPQQNGVSERKNKALKEMVNSMLSYSGLSEGFWESRDAMFDEKRFTSIPRPKSLLPSSNEDQIGKTPIETLTAHRSNRARKEAINDEMDSIMENNTWILSDLPPGCKPLGCKWIFKKKMKVDGTIDKFKARLVIQGIRQKEGIDYFDTYAPVARISTIRLLIALAATYNLVIHQMDVKTTFLNGDLEEETPKQWHQKFDEVVLSDGFVLNQSDKYQVDKMKEFLSSNFSMKDVGEADVILGIRIKREDKVSTPLDPTIKLIPNTGTVVNQLEYSRAIGCLMYAMTSTRPDIAYDVGKLILEGYSDASWITNSEDHTSATGWVFLLGGGAISWASKKQTCNTDSTMEAKFVALVAAGKEAEWLKNLIYEILLWPKPISPISIHCDSVATLAKAYSQIYNEKSRHLGVIHSMVRELITNGVIFVDFVRSHQNMTDHLTKGLARDLVHKLAIGMGLKSIKISNDETPNSLLASARS